MLAENGISVTKTSTISGGITNSGLIQGTGTAILVEAGSSLDFIDITGSNTAIFGGKVEAPTTPTTVVPGAAYTIQDGGLFEVQSFTNNGTFGVAAGGIGTITGAYVQDANGIFTVNVIDDTTYGKLVINGTATLPSNQKIDVDVSNANTPFTATTLADIISATALTSDGTFAVTDNSLLFNYGAVKDGNTVDLTLAAVPQPPTPPPVDNGGGNEIPGGSEPPATTVSAIVEKTRQTSAKGAASVLDQTFASNPTGALSGIFIGLTTEKAVDDAVAQVLPLLAGSSAEASDAALNSISRVIQARIESNYGLSSGDTFEGDRKFWMKPFGSWADQDEQGGAAGYDADTFGIGFGADATISDLTRLGLSFVYAKSNVNSKSDVAQQGADIGVYQLIGYGSQVLQDDVELNFQLGVGRNTNEGSRSIRISNTVGKAEADYDSTTVTAGVGVGKVITMSEETQFLPTARVDYTLISDEDYREKGSASVEPLLLDVESRDTDEMILSVDGKVIHKVSERLAVNANLGLGYDVLSERASLTATFAGAPGASFKTEGVDPDPFMIRGGLGISTDINDRLELSGRYDVETRSEFVNQTASAKLRWSI